MMTSIRRAAALLTVALAATLTGCGSDEADDGSTSLPVAAPTATVTITTFQFAPDPLVVPAGTVITFENNDKIDHTVTAGTREAPTLDVFNGVLAEQGTTFELILDEPGTYDYFCQIHPGPGMTGQITVE
jgi:plastocyanin